MKIDDLAGDDRSAAQKKHYTFQHKWNETVLRLFVYLSSSRPDKMVSETLLWHPMVMKTDLKGQHLETMAWGKALSTIGQAPHTAPLEKLQRFWGWKLLCHGLCHWILCGLLRIVPLKIHVSAIKLVSLCKLHNHKIMLSTHWWCLPQGYTSCCSRPFQVICMFENYFSKNWIQSGYRFLVSLYFLPICYSMANFLQAQLRTPKHFEMFTVLPWRLRR
jgi:hypothetical protein